MISNRAVSLFRLSVSSMSVFAMGLLFAGCSSTPNKVEKVETKLESQGELSGAKIGINDDKQAVIQKEKTPEEELNAYVWKNNELEQQLVLENTRLKNCRRDMSDPRLGGDGNVVDTPGVDDLVETELTKDQVGMNEKGKLVVVKKEFYVERLEREQKKERILKSLQKQIKKQRETCEYQMGVARVKVGLPADRFQPIVEYDNSGKAIVKEKGETSLDEAFRRARRGGAKDDSGTAQ